MTQLPHTLNPGRICFGVEMADDGHCCCRVSVDGAVAMLTVHVDARLVEFDGLVWRDGRVMFEFVGSAPLRGRPVEPVLEALLAERLRKECGPRRIDG